jgi:hypothetical protein
MSRREAVQAEHSRRNVGDIGATDLDVQDIAEAKLIRLQIEVASLLATVALITHHYLQSESSKT